MKIRHVSNYHADMRHNGANMTVMAFLTENLKSYRVRGWIVSGYAGPDSHSYFSSYKKALYFSKTK